MLRQRSPRIHDAAHLKFVRSQPCVICKTSRHIEAAHVRMGCLAIGKEPTGLQEKPSDSWAVSLCAYHHRTGIMAQHKMSEAEFWIMHGRNPFEICERLWIESGGAERALQPKPAPRPRKIKARKPQEMRRKIPAGRPLQSRGFEARR